MFQWRKKEINGHIQTCSNKKTLVQMVDLEPNSDRCESESQTESQTGTNIETKVSLTGGVEPPESSVQPSMTKMCDIDIVEQGSSVQ